jgi:hypothetical protein
MQLHFHTIQHKQILTLRGFTPGDKMKKMGVDGLASSNDLENSTVRVSTYFAPSFSSIKALKYKLHEM